MSGRKVLKHPRILIILNKELEIVETDILHYLCITHIF